MSKILMFTAGLSLLLSVGCSEGGSDDPATATTNTPEDSARVQQMRERLSSLQAEVERVRDGNDIKRLQRAFGYYFDEGMWDALADLFAADAELEYARDGVYRGRERIREYFYHMGNQQQGLGEGELNEHFQLMPVITLSEDGSTAKGRWRDLILKGEYGSHAWWGEGPFENEYVKEDGVWKISRLHWFQTVMVPYEGGWAQNEDVNDGIYVSDELPPDAPPTIEYAPWPNTFLPPFHFDNPVQAPAAVEGAQ